jgi:diguanylate cyclase (GGDEF)-like protein
MELASELQPINTANRQRILLIDDDPLMARLIESLLADDPIELFFACGGEAGLLAASSEQPDLILLDVGMQGLDGFEVCRRLKSDPATFSLPIVFLTGAASIDEKIRGWNLGAVDYVLKPFEPAELRARVRASLRTKALVDLLSRKAMLDGLTGLFNRTYFDMRLAENVSLAKRGDFAFACILIDLDHFKSINDQFGHPFGDQVLKGVGTALAECCRREDVVCRYGGEEFAILSPTTVGDRACTLAERLRGSVARIPFHLQGRRISVTCSVGVGDTHSAAPDDIVASVDAALYKAKRAGRNRVAFVELRKVI